MCSIYKGIGVFDFNNNKQTFALQRCSDPCSIKCYISVHEKAMLDKNLWKQRWDLLDYLGAIIRSAHIHYIQNTRKPIAYVECPFDHGEECAPHISLEAIRSNTPFCTKVNKCIEGAYQLLLEPTDQPGK